MKLGKSSYKFPAVLHWFFKEQEFIKKAVVQYKSCGSNDISGAQMSMLHLTCTIIYVEFFTSVKLIGFY